MKLFQKLTKVQKVSLLMLISLIFLGYLTISSASNTYATKSGLNQGTTEINGGCITTGTLSASKITTGTLDASKVSVTNLNASNITSGTISANKISGGSLNLTGTNTTIASTNFSVNKNGDMTCSNATINGGKITLNDTTGTSGNLIIKTSGYFEAHHRSFGSQYYGIGQNDGYVAIEAGFVQSGGNIRVAPSDDIAHETNITTIHNGYIDCVDVTETSLESVKKNFEKLPSGLELIKDIDIYKYNFKHEEDDTKKHIGFVIGEDYKYNEEITSKDNDGVDLYSFVSVCCKAIQEQQEEIEQLKEQIKVLEER